MAVRSFTGGTSGSILDLDELRSKSQQERFKAMRDHPVWAELYEHWQQKRRDQVVRYGERALRGEFNEVEAAEERGYWKGVMAVLRNRE